MRELNIFGADIVITTGLEAHNELKLKFERLARREADEYINWFYSECETMDDLLEVGLPDGYACINQVIQEAVGELMNHGILNIDLERFIRDYYDTPEKWGTRIKSVHQTYLKTIEEYKEKQTDLKYEYESEHYASQGGGRWTGGGMGPGGMIAGSIFAGGMNFAGDIGREIRADRVREKYADKMRENRKELINRLDRFLHSDNVAMHLYDGIFKTANGVFFALIEILQKHECDIRVLTVGDYKNASALYNNMSQPNFPEAQQPKAIKAIIEGYPYIKDFWLDLLDICEDSEYGKVSELAEYFGYYGIWTDKILDIQEEKLKTVFESENYYSLPSKSKYKLLIEVKQELDSLKDVYGFNHFSDDAFNLYFFDTNNHINDMVMNCLTTELSDIKNEVYNTGSSEYTIQIVKDKLLAYKENARKEYAQYYMKLSVDFSEYLFQGLEILAEAAIATIKAKDIDILLKYTCALNILSEMRNFQYVFCNLDNDMDEMGKDIKEYLAEYAEESGEEQNTRDPFVEFKAFISLLAKQAVNNQIASLRESICNDAYEPTNAFSEMKSSLVEIGISAKQDFNAALNESEIDYLIDKAMHEVVMTIADTDLANLADETQEMDMAMVKERLKLIRERAEYYGYTETDESYITSIDKVNGRLAALLIESYKIKIVLGSLEEYTEILQDFVEASQAESIFERSDCQNYIEILERTKRDMQQRFAYELLEMASTMEDADFVVKEARKWANQRNNSDGAKAGYQRLNEFLDANEKEIQFQMLTRRLTQAKTIRDTKAIMRDAMGIADVQDPKKAIGFFNTLLLSKVEKNIRQLIHNINTNPSNVSWAREWDANNEKVWKEKRRKIGFKEPEDLQKEADTKQDAIAKQQYIMHLTVLLTAIADNQRRIAELRAELSKPIWFAQLNNRDAGPFGRPQLKFMLVNGTLNAHSMVKKEESDWQYISDVDELKIIFQPVWYIAQDGKSDGPFNYVDAMKHIKDSNLDLAKCSVWHNGMAKWLPLSECLTFTH